MPPDRLLGDGKGGGAQGALLLVVGAVGGVGASTLAAALSAELAADGSGVGLVDLDGLRGGIDVLLGVETEPGARWPELADVDGTVEATDLDGVLPTWRGVEVLSAGREAVSPRPEAVASVLGALLLRNAHLVVDLPAHGLGALAGRGPVERPDRTVLLTTQDVRGVVGGRAATPLLPGGEVELVVRSCRDPVVAADEVARLLGLPPALVLGSDRGIAGAVDRGLGPVPARGSRLGRTVRRLAARVSGG